MNERRDREPRDPGQHSIGGNGPESRPPVVLQILPRLDGAGGIERGTMEIARAVAGAGWGSLVASAGGVYESQVAGLGGRHVTLPVESKNPLVMRANIGRLAALIVAENVTVVHARSRAPAWSAYYAAKRTGRPFVTTFHGAYGAGSMIKRRYNAIMTRGDQVIAISEFIARLIADTYRMDEARLRVIPRGVDLEAFSPDKVSQARIIQLANQWRLPDGAPVVMLPGRLTRWKGHKTMLEAMARLGRHDVCCVLVGDDQGREGYRAKLLRQIERLGLGSVVRLVGPCRDMPAAYMMADVVVSASIKPEAFGRVIVEAQAMGRPVVAADHGGASETVRDGETGWLVRPREAEALAAGLRDALALEPARREAVARAAIQHVRQCYSLDVTCQRTLTVYREVMAGKAHNIAA